MVGAKLMKNRVVSKKTTITTAACGAVVIVKSSLEPYRASGYFLATLV